MSLRRLTLVLLVAAARPAHALLLGGVLRPSTLPTGAITLTRCAPVKAQLAPAPTKTRQKTYTNDGGGGKGGGGAPSAAIAKPKRKAHTEEVPLYKVILLGDNEYEEGPVCSVLHSVIPEIENLRQATEKYDEAQNTGKALLIVVNKELGEAYVEQLARFDPEMIVYADLEEE